MPNFQIKYRGRDIFSYRVPRSGATFSSEFEQEEAARWRGLTPKQWDALDGEDQSRIVAHYRAATMLEAVIAFKTPKTSNRKAGR